MCGNYFEVTVPEFIAAGEYDMRLFEKAKYTKSTYGGGKIEFWSDEFTTHKVPDALDKCENKNTLYNFGGIFPACDLVLQSFQELIQITVSCSPTIYLDAILAICDSLRKTNPNDTVTLYFVVSSWLQTMAIFQDRKKFNDLPKKFKLDLVV